MNRRIAAVLLLVPLAAGCQSKAGGQAQVDPPAITPTPAASASRTAVPTSATPSAKTSSATPSASKTSGTSASPSKSVSEEDIKKYALAKPTLVNDYWAAVDDMRNAGGDPATLPKLATIMTGEPLEYWQKVAKDWADNGIYMEGRYTVTLAEQELVAVGPEGGSATFRYCVDATTGTFKNRTPGGPLPTKPQERYRTGKATFLWTDGAWKFSSNKEKVSDTCE